MLRSHSWEKPSEIILHLLRISLFKTLIFWNYVPEGQTYFLNNGNILIFRTKTGTTMDDQNLMPIYLPASTCSLVPFPKIIFSLPAVTQTDMS